MSNHSMSRRSFVSVTAWQRLPPRLTGEKSTPMPPGCSVKDYPTVVIGRPGASAAGLPGKAGSSRLLVEQHRSPAAMPLHSTGPVHLRGVPP